MKRTHWYYLIRHGETDYNLRGMIQGRGVDASLNDTRRLHSLTQCI